ncbi:excinuclease ABC subunit C [Kribbella sp. VKM Ac-2569]|uniref:GIY-YIG nuclease family protein n=1 Tax=Kribbella sp. VKM Ac-2569 TaxID=2512220 RepID=UPI00102C263F|nr:GIY-YIG nuclease family protein [Kribbella sp. VKM Ac-2569]RZT28594.1 excinuclease ABC subunit C [Kribbella sp. VKM Ac-2569]
MIRSVRELPAGPGVYRFRDDAGKVLYIGRARNLRRRVQSYWVNLGDRPHLQRMVRRIARVEGVWCDSEHEAAWLERNLLEHSKPRWNRTEGGAEVVGYIRLADGSKPGLRFEHTISGGGPHFGPYLGGLRIRRAISGLHRVLPLQYTVAGDGSAEEFGRLFGIGPADRDALARTAIAVLLKEPASVETLRSELVRRRDRAAGELRYEFAAKVQGEIEALEWICAEQKVAWMEPRDADVYGWADGVLVRFELRSGRMCTWTQRAVGEATARERVAATPALWQPFARRNAELAARLLKVTS